MSGLVAYDDDVNGRTEADCSKRIPSQRNGFILRLELVGDRASNCGNDSGSTSKSATVRRHRPADENDETKRNA